MRKDAIAPYNSNVKTPFLERFAKDAVVYDNAVSPSPWTLPTHASFLTGKLPSEHGIHERPGLKARDLLGSMNGLKDTLTGYIRSLGYNTIGYSANPWLWPGTGFEKSFMHFTGVDPIPVQPREKESLDMLESELPNVTRAKRIMNYVRRKKIRELRRVASAHLTLQLSKRLNSYPMIKGGNRIAQSIVSSSIEQPFFLFANFMEMHQPYTSFEAKLDFAHQFGLQRPPRANIEKIRKKYYRTAENLDFFFGHIMKSLKARKIYDNSLIILTSDHGQGLFEKDFYGHGIYLYDELVDVPLLIKYPSTSRVFDHDKRPYQSIQNLFPFLKEYLEGSYSTNPLSQEVVFSESYGAYADTKNFSNPEWAKFLSNTIDVPRKAVQANGYKLVVNGSSGIIEEFTHNKQPIDPSENKVTTERLVELIQSNCLDKEFVTMTVR